MKVIRYLTLHAYLNFRQRIRKRLSTFHVIKIPTHAHNNKLFQPCIMIVTCYCSILCFISESVKFILQCPILNRYEPSREHFVSFANHQFLINIDLKITDIKIKLDQLYRLRLQAVNNLNNKCL